LVRELRHPLLRDAVAARDGNLRLTAVENVGDRYEDRG
jgi:hypothetical protein